MNNVAVVVLGDIGRSPRMQYHALSLSKLANTKVSLIGYNESTPHQLIRENENIKIYALKPFPALSEKVRVSLLWPVLAAMKVLFQIIQLFWVLMFSVPRPLNTILVQSPPAIPTIMVLQIVARLRSIHLVIDWHNLGYTLLQLSIKKEESHPIIKFAKWSVQIIIVNQTKVFIVYSSNLIEKTFGRSAYAHLFVTEAMKNTLVKEWGLKGKTFVLHDKPAPIFKYMVEKERLEFLRHFKEKYKISKEKDVKFIDDVLSRKTVMAISSTSWTPDEDFSILLAALAEYDRMLRRKGLGDRPDLLFFITGKGPQKEYYEAKIAELNLARCHVITVWLDSEDYPKLLGCADVGVSLHRSSSGLDLPMKVVDMFGCCVPCYAVNFKCIEELVKPGFNGRVFTDSLNLSQYFFDDFIDFPSTKLTKFRDNLRSERDQNTWENEWKSVKPIFDNNATTLNDKKKR
ncbi:glycosyltransferase [Heterostelium album PN500]|uniref:Beta-1,4-mannosyltransferase n=1 Tax=Heterostelium pallidum (strain ATCC 26659 / Pp 5 / PN500) TaxID=670386 RepID=D3BNL4_HETP5|nr:glycosyltransferase [Heterostelium album PN500]EFA76965.1 glycosyltransferase [Heterostelium album PN500]|eukprot:XP_020429096.1 glycosyltransferase [Heterostelium album PN500]